MNSLNKFKKDLKNCSRCGLCQAVCPIFEITKNDSTSPKGKFILLNEMLKNGEKPSKKLINYMKTCLNCGKCVEYCPSKIDIKEINKAFDKDFSASKLNLFLLVEDFVSSITFKKYEENKSDIKLLKEKFSEFSKNKKIVYLKNYEEEKLPEIINGNKSVIVQECGASLKFRHNNPKLYLALAKTNVQKILLNDFNYIITNNFLCKKEIEQGFSALEVKKEIISLEEFIKTYLQV